VGVNFVKQVLYYKDTKQTTYKLASNITELCMHGACPLLAVDIVTRLYMLT